VALEGVLRRITVGEYVIGDCTYASMTSALWHYFNRFKRSGLVDRYKRKVLAPDDKPVELSRCSQISQSLFIDPKASK
jgi:hypothetical protein